MIDQDKQLREKYKEVNDELRWLCDFNCVPSSVGVQIMLVREIREFNSIKQQGGNTK